MRNLNVYLGLTLVIAATLPNVISILMAATTVIPPASMVALVLVGFFLTLS